MVLILWGDTFEGAENIFLITSVFLNLIYFIFADKTRTLQISQKSGSSCSKVCAPLIASLMLFLSERGGAWKMNLAPS